MKRFNSFQEIEDVYPGAAKIVAWENKQQHPNAKFLEAVVGSYAGDPNTEDDLVILFDLGVDGEVLFCWVTGDLEDSIPFQGAYIDEYYVMTTEQGKFELECVQ